MTDFKRGPFNIQYSPYRLSIDNGKRYVEIMGDEPVTIFMFFTDDCENIAQLTRYFDVASVAIAGE